MSNKVHLLRRILSEFKGIASLAGKWSPITTTTEVPFEMIVGEILGLGPTKVGYISEHLAGILEIEPSGSLSPDYEKLYGLLFDGETVCITEAAAFGDDIGIYINGVLYYLSLDGFDGDFYYIYTSGVNNVSNPFPEVGQTCIIGRIFNA